MITYNTHIAGLCARLQKYVVEMHKSVSAGLYYVNEHDMKRFLSYFDEMLTYVDQKKQIQTDRGEAHPDEIQLPAFPTLPKIENEFINDFLREAKQIYEGFVFSQSSREVSGFIIHDSTRFISWLEQGRAHFSDYVAKVSPLDMVESTPLRPLSGHGLRHDPTGAK